MIAHESFLVIILNVREEYKMKKVIEVRNLVKEFQNVKALKGIDFDVYRGEVLCLLGPNGAGKSTTINILSTALKFDEGEILLNKKDIFSNVLESKKSFGIVPQEVALYEDLSAERNIEFFASLYGLRGELLNKRVNEALEFAGLHERRKHKVKTFSGGMKRRLNIACALAHKPDIIIMDEPTVGIDPQSRNYILDSIKKLQEKGVTIVYSTHYMEEVEEISTRIIIIDHGEIIAEGTKEKLKKSISNGRMSIVEVEDAKSIVEEEFFEIEGVKGVSIEKNKILINSLKGVQNLDRIIAKLIDMKVKIKNITSQEASLETVFLNLTGRSLRD